MPEQHEQPRSGAELADTLVLEVAKGDNTVDDVDGFQCPRLALFSKYEASVLAIFTTTMPIGHFRVKRQTSLGGDSRM